MNNGLNNITDHLVILYFQNDTSLKNVLKDLRFYINFCDPFGLGIRQIFKSSDRYEKCNGNKITDFDHLGIKGSNVLCGYLIKGSFKQDIYDKVFLILVNLLEPFNSRT